MAAPSLLYSRIYAVIRCIPAGEVATYGMIGQLVGCPARVVGYALHYLRTSAEEPVPWQRVINYKGGISTAGPEQRQLLEEEGVVFNAEGRVDLQRFGWDGRGAQAVI
ncbi:MAG: MGMT family protein [Herpetosiphonaceae bacterium]|nr:MGMT family protein [Herpetosiphonaceae bacterium]